MGNDSVSQVLGLTGIRPTRAPETIFIPLPRAMWRRIEGGCSCKTCKVQGESSMYWDTLAISAKPMLGDYTWNVHHPELRSSEAA
jgi:hypothetical protein